MAIDFSGVKFLLWAKNLGVSFDQTLTLGHLCLSCSHGRLRRAFRDFETGATSEDLDRCFEHEPFQALFADGLLRFLGAKEVVSVDRSDFEGATLLHDLNLPFPEHLRGSFDLVVDGGTLEHVFNYPAALSNCLDLLRVGGHFITITPATGQMGHGFYQFSPELFFRVFSEKRGFALRKIILFECLKINSPFYEINDPASAGERSVSPGNRVMQLAVLAQKIAKTPTILEPPQQSDYAAIWENHEKIRADKSEKAAPPGFIRRMRVAINPYWPFWLRGLRDACRHHWFWIKTGLKFKLGNRRHLRRLDDREIFSERSRPVPVKQTI